MRLTVVLLFVAACSAPIAAPPPLSLAEGCQPLLAGADCMLPYPSDFFRAPNATKVTGFRIEVAPAARLRTKSGASADAHQAFAADGFSPVNPIVTFLPVDVTDEGFVHLADDPALSLSAATSHTLILDADGVPVPHFVDLDPHAIDVTRRAIILHALVPLKDQARYSVFLFGVKSAGALAPTPEGFRRIRDGVTGGEAALAPQLEAWKTRLHALATKAQIELPSLQLAWEFSTGSQQNVVDDMQRVRALTLEWLTTHTPEVTVTSEELNPYSDTWKVVQGTISMPLFTDLAGPGARLNRGADGQVAQNGTSSFPFMAIVPSSVRDATTVRAPFLYGHGFFGGFDELTGGSARNLAFALGRTMVAAEWWGMATPDVPKVGDALLSHPSNVLQFTDRVHQGFANWIVLADATEKVFPALPVFQRSGAPFLAPDASRYLGISQGTILGVGMVATNPYVKRAAMEVGGSGFTGMMFRAEPFKQFLDLLADSVPDPLDQQKFIASLQRQMDRIDPNTYARNVQREPFPGTPPRQVLLQIGLGDTEVPNFGSELLARALEVKQLQPAPKTVWGLEAASGTTDRALELYDFGVDVAALYKNAAFPLIDSGVHDGIRRLTPTIDQTAHLFDDGVISHFCSGVCDPD
jgi:hypothetical protein